MRHLFLIFCLGLLVVSCEQDKFGDTAKDYIDSSVRDDSRSLVINDAQFRFLNASSSYIGEMNNDILDSYEKINIILSDLELITSKSIESDAQSILEKNLAHYTTIKELSDKAEFLQRKAYVMDNLCEEDALRFRTYHKNALTLVTSSFANVGTMSKYYQPDNYIYFGKNISFDGNPNDDIQYNDPDYEARPDSTGPDEVRAAGSLAGYAGYYFSGGNYYVAAVCEQVGEVLARAVISEHERKEFRKQKKVLTSSISSLPQKVISAEETLGHIKTECTQMQKEFDIVFKEIRDISKTFTIEVQLLKKKYFSKMKEVENYLLEQKESSILFDFGFSDILTGLDNSRLTLSLISNLENLYVDLSNEMTSINEVFDCFEKHEKMASLVSKMQRLERLVSSISGLNSTTASKYAAALHSKAQIKLIKVSTEYNNFLEKGCM